MNDAIILVLVGFIFFTAVFFSSISVGHLFQNKKLGFDKGFLPSLSACFLALVLCLFIWPPVHRVYDDEFSYISQSVNILSFGKASIILKGSSRQPDVFASWIFNTKLPGFACLEACILFLAKDFEHSYFILNMFLGIASVAVVYRIAWLWTASYTTAWWSAIFLACLPARITYSMSTASDIAGSFFFLLFLLFLSEFKTIKSMRIWYAALFCGAYSVCIKQLYGVFVMLGLAIALYTYQRAGLLDKKLYRQMALDVVCLFLPILIAIIFLLLPDSKANFYSFSFIFKNLCTSISYLFNYKENAPLIVLAMLAAILRSIFYKKDNLVIGLAAWFWGGILMISVFSAGGISYPGDAYSDRYLLLITFPCVFLAAKGITDLASMGRSRLLMGLLFIILVINAFFASHKLDSKAKVNPYYEKTFLLKKMVHVIPDKAYLIDETTALVATETPMKSIQTSLFLSGDHPKEIVFLKGIDDFTDPHRIDLVENILNTEYICRLLVTTPFKERGLSAMPLLCTRRQ